MTAFLDDCTLQAAVMMFLEGREAMLVAEPCHMKEVNDHDLSIGAAQSAQGSPVLRECNAAQMPATGGKVRSLMHLLGTGIDLPISAAGD